MNHTHRPPARWTTIAFALMALAALVMLIASEVMR
jgi:hypothetical protein